MKADSSLDRLLDLLVDAVLREIAEGRLTADVPNADSRAGDLQNTGQTDVKAVDA